MFPNIINMNLVSLILQHIQKKIEKQNRNEKYKYKGNMNYSDTINNLYHKPQNSVFKVKLKLPRFGKCPIQKCSGSRTVSLSFGTNPNPDHFGISVAAHF